LTKTVFGLLRHGQTDWNAQLRLQGVSDIPLNEVGLLQAQKSLDNLSATDWDVILASPLSRSIQTATVIADSFGLEVSILPELIERSFGEAEGLSHTEWRRVFESQEPIPGLESMEALEERAQLLLDRVSRDFAGKRVLAISHGSLIRKVIRMVSNQTLPRDGDRMENLSLNIFEHENGTWEISSYSSNSLAN
jgi:broad specificity phosphatase PhoE